MSSGHHLKIWYVDDLKNCNNQSNSLLHQAKVSLVILHLIQRISSEDGKRKQRKGLLSRQLLNRYKQEHGIEEKKMMIKKRENVILLMI